MARTAGSGWSWGLLGALGLLALAQPSGCKDGGNNGEEETPTAVAVSDALAAVGPEVVLPALERFQAATGSLAAALVAWQEALASGGDADGARAAAQDAWKAAMAVWQELEVMQIGPAGSSLTAVAGADIRDEIYSWPSINPCRVDQETVEESWDSEDYFTENLVNSYGLDAIEHLLFAGPDNDCPGQVDINAEGTWDALGEAGVMANRADFAAALLAEVQRQAAGLQTTWSPEGGDFSGLLTAEPSGTPYESEQQALNAVFNALFYLETMTKDRKLAQPLGLQECGEATCPDDVEGLESGQGAAFIAANLRGFRSLFTGGDGAGMDDLLAELGHGDLGEQILADTDAALALAEAMTSPLDELITSDPASVQALHDAVKTVTDALKGDLATVLVMQIPDEAAGDND